MPTFSGGSCGKIWALAAFESDTVDLVNPTRAIFVSVAGNIVITLLDDTEKPQLQYLYQLMLFIHLILKDFGQLGLQQLFLDYNDEFNYRTRNKC